MNVTEEARQLNVKIEKEPDGSFVAALADADDEMVLPGATPEEALLEARAFRAIEQSELYLVNYNEAQDEYEVTFANDDLKMVFRDKHLHKAYEMAQAHYATQFKVEEPPAVVEEPKPNGAARRTRKAKIAPVIEPEPEPVIPEHYTTQTGLDPQADRLMTEVITAFVDAHTKLITALRVILTEEKK